ncbi:hypothetical protein D9613_004679 [Agrocybe pediades]|uniref:Uncharacterized protein n=1 Tax=Agrocybe pediades TaxID=84607 RepID=A0A8H4QXN2_9AGAR|nr:hypothetical protein D9613_004679 [Agrocybe pediades]
MVDNGSKWYKCQPKFLIADILTTYLIAPRCIFPAIFNMSDNTPQVFVDDSDPSVIYSGQDAWVGQTKINTAPQPSNLPERAPFYGTQHHIKGNGSLSYVFTGSNISALFSGGSELELFFTASCTVDGAEVGEPFLGSNVVTCPGVDLPPGEHNLTMSFTQTQDSLQVGTISPPAFDGFFYTPSNTEQLQQVDIAYPPESVNVTFGLSAPGDKVDFTFNGMFPPRMLRLFFLLMHQILHSGTSMALYVTYKSGDNVPVGLSYNIDAGPFIKFTLDNPWAGSSSDSDQLILQTPQYGQGQHRFHLDFLGPSDKDQVILIDHLIVQNNPNTKKLVGLQVFPPVSSSGGVSSNSPPGATALASPTPTPQAKPASHHHIGQRTIIAIAVTLPSVLVILILSLLFIKRRSRRHKSATGSISDDGSEVRVTPFLSTRVTRRMEPTSSKRMLDSPPNLVRGGAENISKAPRPVILSQAPTQAAALPPPTTSVPATRAPIPAAPAAATAQAGTEEPIYRIHDDGGSVHELSFATQGQRQVIDLPPLYSSTFGRRQESSRDSVHEPDIA